MFTRYLHIVKNYTLSIFMVSGSIQFYSNFQFNMTCICHKIMSFISNYTHAYSFSHAFTLQIIDHIKICIFHMQPIYLTQIMRFKHILPRMYLVYKSHLHSSNFVISLCLYNSHSGQISFGESCPFCHSVMCLHI